LPVEELSDKSRLGFQIEQAYWFYEDFSRPSNPLLPKLTLKSFGERLIAACLEEEPYASLLPPILGKEGVEGLIGEFYKYKSHVPTCGAIILNRSLDKVPL